MTTITSANVASRHSTKAMRLKTRLRETLFAADPLVAEALSWLNAEQGSLRAICLHAVKESAEPSRGLAPDFEINRDELRRLVDLLLRKQYQFITPSHLARDLDRRGRYMMVTFDDGYFTASFAVELFKAYGLPITLFLCPYFMDTQMTYWSDALLRGFENDNTPTQRRREVERTLRGLPQKEREQYLLEHFGPECLKPLGDADRPLTTDELKRLWSYGNVEVGNHSWSHADLSRCSPAQIEEELELAQRYVEDAIGIRPTSMAFPYGLFNDDVLHVVRRMGFTSALSTVNRLHSVTSL